MYYMLQVCLFRRHIDTIESRWQVSFCIKRIFVCLFSSPPFRSSLFVLLPYLAADAALKEEHVIDGRTIDVKRAVPRDRAPLPRLVRV